MSLEDILTNAAVSVLVEQMRPNRRVHIEPRPFVLPVLPPPPVQVPQQADWPASFQASIDSALDRAWAPATVKAYKGSVNTFLKFCQQHRIPPAQTFPALDYLLCAFLADLSPNLSKHTVKNYLAGIRAWHIRNGYPFTRSDRLNLLAKASRPLSSPNAPRPPVTMELMVALANSLDISQSFDACVFACACSAFWGLARLGELLPATHNFDHKMPPFPRVLSVSPGRAGSLKLSLPWTKVKKWEGEVLILPVQDEPCNPISAINNHLAVNSLPNQSLLFSYHDNLGSTVMLKRPFLTRCNEIWSAASPKAQAPTGHSFRIGGTSHLLMCGIHPDIIKQTGRWSSDSFLRYWRNLDVVIPNHASHAKRQTGPLGEPRASLGCGLLPSGVASTAGASTSVARSKTAR